MNILITGGTGFVGSHMIDFILKNETDVKIFATKRWMEDTKNVEHIDDDRFEFIDCDLLDGLSVERAIGISKPDKVFHFAAQSFPEVSFKTPVVTLQTNTIGTTHLLESIKESEYNPVIVSVSTSEVYGMPTKDELPIKETNPIRAANPYSISKVGHDLMSQYYYKAYGVKVIVTRMFSHEGARRGKQFALSSFSYQIVQNEKLIKNDCGIRHGNLESVRTYNHIEDAIIAYWLCSESDRYGEVYNIGGGRYSNCSIIEALYLFEKISKIHVKKNFIKKNRVGDHIWYISNLSKFKKDYPNWKQKYNTKKIIEELIEKK